MIPQSQVQNTSAALTSAEERMDELVAKRFESGNGSPTLSIGLLWAGFSAKTALQKILMFWRYNFENAIEADVIDSIAYGYTSEDGRFE